MLFLYAIADDRLVRVEPGPAPRTDVVWADLLNPTREEEQRVEGFLGIGVPTREEMAEIEVSSRLYREGDAIYMTASLLHAGEKLPAADPVTFILTKGRLVTVRYSEPGVFRTFVKQTERPEVSLKDADAVFGQLIEAIIDRTADILEHVGLEADKISQEVFAEPAAGKPRAEPTTRDYKVILNRIGRCGDLNSKVRDCLVSIGRMVNYLSGECDKEHPYLKEHLPTMAADLRSLADHSSYVAGTVVFLLDATLGLVNIQQNNIINILSVVSVVIMPPTLIASIYGMNFDHMPELHAIYGYPLALLAMIAAAALPLWYFRRRGWL